MAKTNESTTFPRDLRAVVTGASTGIGAATARHLVAAGWYVLAIARRADRLEALAAEIGCDLLAADITSEADVARIVEAAGEVHALINNAGGARGTETVADADLEKWSWMYDVNVLGTVRLTKALLPSLRTSGRGDIVVVSSVAGQRTYAGGGGYTAAKHAERVVAETLRLELNGEPIRVIEIVPGLVHTEEFSLRRLGGDQASADAVYAGVPNPLAADDIAEAISWTLSRPHHVNIDQLVIKPLAQAAIHKMHRTS
ncbi:SDR family oxidoreductase [Paeniglutamicibacter gangotriensis]|uniref:Metabolite dehydrogenase, NAD-binding protein n=1 Tax=Paeniglutamicibacter gangotriensis Lz1y TaxID=1276920 RepID=M7NPT0_9MICC|nr:SDR family oxidoreductase [Paeniglutamicibacter gangotriensis]EMR00539.1 metabolite dehydrogenase, NAD-binding protein [Paeniglutamicibacter gangotriensis Lz1y]